MNDPKEPITPLMGRVTFNPGQNPAPVTVSLDAMGGLKVGQKYAVLGETEYPSPIYEPNATRVPKERGKLVQRVRTMLEDSRQYLRDVEHWNSLGRGEPIEADPDGQVAAIIQACERCLAVEEDREKGPSLPCGLCGKTDHYHRDCRK